MHRKFVFFLVIFFMVTVLFSGIIALSAANIVSDSGLTDTNLPVSISELAPPECASISSLLEAVVDCQTQKPGFCSGSGNTNELILGTPGNETIAGKNGDDCIVGGGGDDYLDGENGNDVLVGGPGIDTLNGNGRPKDVDLCFDDSGSTTFIDCEVIQ